MASTKIRQFWMVVPLDVKQDDNGGRLGGGEGRGELAAGFAEPARPAQRNRPPELIAPAEPAKGYGWKIQSGEMKRLQWAFTTEEAACEYAKDQAEKSPKVLFGVFPCTKTYETTTPTVIQKSFNQDGELTPVEKI